METKYTAHMIETEFQAVVHERLSVCDACGVFDGAPKMHISVAELGPVSTVTVHTACILPVVREAFYVCDLCGEIAANYSECCKK